jgi:GAF domain-containing protein
MRNTDEAERQRVLDMYRIVDTLPESAYQDIVQLASTLCDTPIALLTLIDRDRQWFKASLGLDETQTRREDAFCARAIEAPSDLMEVPDAQQDPRFLANPYVTGAPHVRFYAGMPLVAPGGEAMGTVCVIDEVPRRLDDRQRKGLAALSRLTMTLLDARVHERELERAVAFAESAAAHPGEPFTVMILQAQGTPDAVTRMGDRAVERQLQVLEQHLGGVLKAGSGDSVNRTTDSPDFIAVLRAGAHETERRLRECAATFTRESGMAVLSASAKAERPDDRIELVYLRADEALTRIKDEAAAMAATPA